jgi:thioredoxin reductase/SAM-dependent methyltransferase
MDESYDVVVVGGGAAGLSGALALARSRRSVLVLDAGDPRNATAGHVHNFLTRDGTAPSEIYAAGRAEVTGYGGRVEPGLVTAIQRDGDRFRVEVGDGGVAARRVLVTTGLRDELPDIPGLAERWGIDVLHCPNCHGWEVRDRRIGILVTGPVAVHQAQLFRRVSDHVTLLHHTGPAPTEEQREQLEASGVAVVDGEVVAVETASDGLSGVRLADGSRVGLDALVVAPRYTARAELLASLGIDIAEMRVGDHVIGTRIEADPAGATAVAGVWVAGNVADLQAQVITAAAAGLAAGAAINADLVAEDTRRAVEALRQERVHGQRAWDERYLSRPQTWSGNPNPTLVTEVVDLTPGTALDAGAGEGADACWLAGQGWKVTAVELSIVALQRAAGLAERRGVDVTWRHVDLAREAPPGAYDLVTAHYLHSPVAYRRALFARLAAAVAPGGTLLVVGHDPSDMHTGIARPHLAEVGWHAHEVAESLGDGWTVERAEARPRLAHDADGREISIHDAVFRARRTSHPDSADRAETGI